jgi:hypothetical protein
MAQSAMHTSDDHATPRSHAMGYAELIERLQALPRDKQAEVFDFVEFLSARSGKEQAHARGEWSDTEFADLAMAQALRGLEDDPVAYTLADLRERWQ